MDSPQHHRAPHAMRSPGHVAPINLGLPLHAPHAAPGNDPFLAPPAPAPAVFNGHQYNHLPAALAQQLAAMPPAPVPIGRGRGRGRGRGHGHGHQAHPHPNVVPPPILPPAQNIGHGQGHVQGHAPAPALMVC